MLNLTDSPIVLIAASGERTRIEPSGYTARVETERRVYDAIPRGVHPGKLIPIYEETPKEIVFSFHGIDYGNRDFERSNETLLVTREVAEAAAALHHPLAARMVWTDSPVYGDPDGLGTCPGCDTEYSELIGYRALLRVPGVGR